MAGSLQSEATSLGADFVDASLRALASGRPEQVSDAQLERVMTAAIRLYAAKVELENPDARPFAPDSVTPTDIVVTVSALIRHAGLNLWDVSMWLNRMKR